MRWADSAEGFGPGSAIRSKHKVESTHELTRMMLLATRLYITSKKVELTWLTILSFH